MKWAFFLKQRAVTEHRCHQKAFELLKLTTLSP
jgi:hypothetical protein